MRTVPLYILIEAAAAAPGEKHLTGNITEFETFTRPENLRKLDSQHHGAFAFLAFHPAADTAVAQYVQGETLGPDSGRDVLVLFTEAETSAWRSTPSMQGLAGVVLDAGEHPAYTMVKWLFPASPPALPGVLLFNQLCGDVTAVYVSLAGLDETAVRQRMRDVFALAATVARTQPFEFGHRVGAALSSRGIPYVKNERLSLHEWLAKGWRLVRDKKYEIVAFAASFIPKPQWPAKK